MIFDMFLTGLTSFLSEVIWLLSFCIIQIFINLLSLKDGVLSTDSDRRDQKLDESYMSSRTALQAQTKI